MKEIWLLVSTDGTWHEKVNYAALKANRVLGLKNMVKWNSTKHLSNIRQATPIIRFISLEPTFRIPLKNIRNCQAQSNSHEGITPPALRRKTWFDRPVNKTRNRWFHTDLQDCARYRRANWCDENKNTMTRSKYNRPKASIPALTWANNRKWSKNTFPSQQNGDPMEKFNCYR